MAQAGTGRSAPSSRPSCSAAVSWRWRERTSWPPTQSCCSAPFSSKFNLVETLVKAAPITFTGLAVAVAFRARFWNIGAEGQLLAGAMAAAFVGGRAGLPGWSLVPLMVLAGMAAGAFWALIPALLKTRYKVDDVVTTLLLNFIIFYAMMALLDGPWKDPLSGYPDSPDIRVDAEFPILLGGTRLHLGVLLALVAAPIVWFVMRRTTLGFNIRAVGESPTASRYAGLDIPVVIAATAALSGALAGLAGVGEVGGIHFQVMSGLSPGYGYTGNRHRHPGAAQSLGGDTRRLLLRRRHHRRRGDVEGDGRARLSRRRLSGRGADLHADRHPVHPVPPAGPEMTEILGEVLQVGFFAAILRIATPLILATLGEMFTERGGVLNLGIEGIMLLGSMTGFSTAYFTGSLWLGVLAAMATGAIAALLMGLLTVTLGLSQHVSGIGTTLLCTGLAFFFYRLIFGQPSVPPSVQAFRAVSVPLLSKIPFVGPVLFDQFALVYLALLLVPAAAFVLYRTPWGLSLRAVGENPRAADGAGVSVARTRYQGLVVSGMLMGAAGAYLSMAQFNAFTFGVISGPRLGLHRAGRLRPVESLEVSGRGTPYSLSSTRCSCACRRAASSSCPTRSS